MSELTQAKPFKLKNKNSPDNNRKNNSNESIKVLANKTNNLEENNLSKIKNYRSVDCEQNKKLITNSED
jgi:hypothetical protein